MIPENQKNKTILWCSAVVKSAHKTRRTEHGEWALVLYSSGHVGSLAQVRAGVIHGRRGDVQAIGYLREPTTHHYGCWVWQIYREYSFIYLQDLFLFF